MKKLRVAQIGALHEHSDGIIRTLRNRLGDVFEIAGIAAENPEAEETHREDACYRGLPWMSPEDIFQLPALDAVFVETEMRELVPTARRCFEHNLPIHIDKPGGETLEPYAALVRDFHARGLPFQTGYMLRWNHAVNFMKKAVSKGWLGQIFDVDADMHRSEGNAEFRKWFAEYSGGTMFNYGSHIIDVLVGLLGAPEKIVPFSRHVTGDAVSDTWVTVFVYPKTLATLRSSTSHPAGIPNRGFTIRGTKGMIRIFPLEQGYDKRIGYPKFNDVPTHVHMLISQDNEAYAAGEYDVKLAPMPDRYEEQLREFADLLRGGKANPYTADYEILVQKAILAASGYIQWETQA